MEKAGEQMRNNREEVSPRLWSAENQGKQGLGKQGFLVHVTACHPGVWLTTTTLSEGVVSTLHRAEGTRLPSEFTWMECRLLAGPEHTQNFYMLVFQRKGEHRPYRDGDLPLWSPKAKDYCRGLKGQGLLQGFKEGFLQNHSGESFPSNTGCFLFHPHPHLHFTYTNVPCPSIRASLISPNPNFPSLKYLFRVNFQVCEVGMPQEKTPQIHEFCFGKCQECNNNHSKIVNNHKNHQKSTTIIKHHQKSRNIIIFFGDFSHTQPFPLPGRGLSESLAPGQVKIAHTSLEMDWDWMIPWVWCVFIDFYFFDFCFCVVYVWCGENVLLFCLLSHCLSVTGHPLGW